jgi:hypothetical protein
MRLPTHIINRNSALDELRCNDHFAIRCERGWVTMCGIVMRNEDVGEAIKIDDALGRHLCWKCSYWL